MKGREKSYSNKRTINSLLIISGVLLITATFIFTYQIPKLDSIISQKEMAMDNFWKNGEMYTNAQESALITKIADGIINMLPTNDQQKMVMDNLKEEWVNYKTIQFLLTYDKTNEPSSEDIERIRHLPLNELEATVNTRFEEYVAEHNSTTVKEFNHLNKKKDVIVFWSILFQIIGLVLNQIALILQLRLTNK
jgi:hypothetical protein